jgi:hypothetical protein
VASDRRQEAPTSFFFWRRRATAIKVLTSHKITRLRQHQRHSQILEVRHMSISSVSAVLCSTDGYAPMVLSFSIHTPCLHDLARRHGKKAAILLMPAFTAGKCIDLSRSGYPSSSSMALATELRVDLPTMHATQWKPEWPVTSLLVQKNVRLSTVAVMARAIRTRSSSKDVQGNGQLRC